MLYWNRSSQLILSHQKPGDNGVDALILSQQKADVFKLTLGEARALAACPTRKT